MINNKNNTTTRISIRKALTYYGCNNNMYYGNKNRRYTIATAVGTPSTKNGRTRDAKISLQRPTYGTRRMAAMLTRVLGIPINKNRVQRINHNRIHFSIRYLTPYEFLSKW